MFLSIMIINIQLFIMYNTCTINDVCTFIGPGVVISLLIAASSCILTALAYSEFAARLPVTGSAYSYAYASFGEFLAWM